MDIGNRIKQFREEKNLTQKDIAKILEVEPGTISKYESNLIEPNIRSLIKLSDTFQISVDELLKDEEVYFDLDEIDILATLQEQKEINLDGNLYHNTQIIFAYNSTHIEGNKLSKNQTKNIFETNTIPYEGNSLIHINDIFKIYNHFKLFNYMLDYAGEMLTDKMIVEYYSILENGIIDNITEKQLEKDIDKLLSWYNSLSKISFEKIIEFLVRFDKLKPFKNDNGIIGRMIAFKECLKNDIIPFIVLDKDKLFYFRGLDEYKNKKDKNYLIDTLIDAQNDYAKIIEKFLK